MTHDFHEAWPTDYDSRQILKDHCAECAERSADLYLAIGHMDVYTFERAWKRAAEWQQDEEVGRVSDAERPLLETLWALQIKLEERGVPIGIVPGAKHLRASA